MSWFPWSSKKRVSSLDALDNEFRPLIESVLADIESRGLKFKVFETYRTPARQKMLLATGKSRKKVSNHCKGLACDIVHLRNGHWDWSDFNDYLPLGEIIKKHPKLRWGGSWRYFKDGAHIELR